MRALALKAETGDRLYIVFADILGCVIYSRILRCKVELNKDCTRDCTYFKSKELNDNRWCAYCDLMYAPKGRHKRKPRVVGLLGVSAHHKIVGFY